MNARPTVSSLMVEFLRFGSPSSAIRQNEPYLRTMGWDQPVRQVTIELSTEEFFRQINRLRHGSRRNPGEVEEAQRILSEQACKMLEPLPSGSPEQLVQVDLVMSAAELWAFPFEAAINGRPLFAARERGLVPTRRIRGEFAAHLPAWPVEPQILFAHAPEASDLSRELIDDQIAALSAALVPWTKGRDPLDARLLTVKQVRGAWDLKELCEQTAFTHIHLLAHGLRVEDPEIPERVQWGLRLGDEGTKPTLPREVGEAFMVRDGRPVVVTLAACDSANQANSGLAAASLAQELHLRGVPVVLASQLPLTKTGATLMTGRFYQRLLAGEDVRAALHDVRASLYEANIAGHDWLSLVAYVRLPEGYADHLDEVGLRAELGMLEATQRRAEALVEANSPAAEYDAVAARIRDRIISLGDRLRRLNADRRGLFEECSGLYASAHKRLAELQFNRAVILPAALAAEERRASRTSLEHALDYYRTAFHASLNSHWAGTQQLALEAVLTGRVESARDWHAALRAAEIGCDDQQSGYWGFASIAELLMLAPYAGEPQDLPRACDALRAFRAQAPNANIQPVELTRRQLSRYVRWWTNGNGFFPGANDLAASAAELLVALK